MDWIYFSHNSHVGDLVTLALAQLDNIPEQLNWQFYHQISDESTLCRVWWIHFMNATTSLICHVKCWGAEGPLSATKSEGWGLESPPANGFGRGVLIVCVVYSDVVFRRLWAAGDSEAQWISLSKGLAGSFYSNPFKCIHVFWSVLVPRDSYSNVLCTQICCYSPSPFQLPVLSNICNKGFAPISVLFKLVSSLF